MKFSFMARKAGTVIVAIAVAAFSIGSPVIAAGGPATYAISGSASTSGLTVTVSGGVSASNPVANGANHHISVNWDVNGTGTWQTVQDLVPDGDGNIPATSYSTQHTYAAGGSYTVKVLIHHANVAGNESSSQTFTTTITVAPPATCSDGNDNDGDGKTDYPADPGCASSSDTDESNPVITATAGAHGSIDPSGSVGVATGANQTFTITPSSGYQISELLVDGVAQTVSGSYTFTNVTSNHSISASFSLTPPGSHTITATACTGGTITPAGAVTVTNAGSQTFTITPSSGYQISELLVDGQSVSTASSYTFSNVIADHTIAVSFSAIPPVIYTITATAGTGGTISPSGSVSVTAGAGQTFTVAASSGFQVSQVLVDGVTATLTGGEYAFTAVSANHTIAASFEEQVAKVENTLTLCTDGEDNDGDESVDLNDQDCSSYRPTLTVVKVVVNDNGGVGAVEDFPLYVGEMQVTSGATSTLDVGTYVVSETASSSYAATFSGDCDANGSVTLVAGEAKTCTITNDDIGATIVVDENPSNGHGGGGKRRGSVLGVSTTTEPTGQVLGASCSPILEAYLRKGKANPQDQVVILQNFLNGELGIQLPITGFFGILTEKAVKDFQLKYFNDVLSPWVAYGLPNDHAATGYVYKTTKWMINNIACAEANTAKPTLP